jgi:hypothetical protein
LLFNTIEVDFGQQSLLLFSAARLLGSIALLPLGVPSLFGSIALLCRYSLRRHRLVTLAGNASQ